MRPEAIAHGNLWLPAHALQPVGARPGARLDLETHAIDLGGVIRLPRAGLYRSMPTPNIRSLVLLAAVSACDRPAEATDGGAGTSATKPVADAKSGAVTPAGSASRKAMRVAAGHSAACALMDDGSVRCWGRNDGGEHGIGASPIDAATPVAIPGVSGATEIWMGGDSGSSGDSVCIRTKAGGIACWAGVSNRPKTEGKAWTDKLEEIPELAGTKDLALGGGTQYAVLADGSVTAWGSPAFNAIGDGDTQSSDKGLTKVPGIAKATAVSAGQNHGCALIDDGTVTCWGYVGPKQAPKKIEGLADVTAIASGAGSDGTCAITKSKGVSCWGESQKPVAEAGLVDATRVRARTETCALAGDGSVRCWGSNDRGEAGIGSREGSNGTKQPVVDLGTAVHIDVGMGFACAALADGNAKCWGWNNHGQLGNGTLIDQSKPVLVAGLQADPLAPATDGSDQAQESAVNMDWSGLPSACNKPTKIAATNRFLHGDFAVASAYATSSGAGKYVNVHLASFKMDPKRLYDGPRGNQFALELSFGKVDLASKTASGVDVGQYVFGLDTERKVMSTVKHKSGTETLMQLSLAGASPGSVTIRHLDGTWICGELALATKESTFTGPFAARIGA